jgi:hypothetical protein
VISRWQEVYLSDTKLSLVGYVPGVSPTPDFRGVEVGGGHASGIEAGTGVGGANTGDDDEGANPTGVDIGGEQHHLCQGQACSSGGGHC